MKEYHAAQYVFSNTHHITDLLTMLTFITISLLYTIFIFFKIRSCSAWLEIESKLAKRSTDLTLQMYATDIVLCKEEE